MSSTSQEKSRRLLKKKLDSYLASLRLTPSEIESLREDSRKAAEYCRGKFSDLFPKKK